jgi:hypothetical protein
MLRLDLPLLPFNDKGLEKVFEEQKNHMKFKDRTREASFLPGCEESYRNNYS